jgi:hypothetical protein
MHSQFCSIVPPYLLRRLAQQDAPGYSSAASAARKALGHVESFQSARAQATPALTPGVRPVKPGPANRTIYDAAGGESLPGRQVRGEGGPATGTQLPTKPTTHWGTRTVFTPTPSAATRWTAAG